MTHTEGAETEYNKTSSVQSLSLIHEVKKYEVLYNQQLAGYTDVPKKEQIWDEIHEVLFPNYPHMSEKTKNVIRRTVRKRWKYLRDALVKNTRLRSEDELYEKKKQSQLMEEMQFLVPYIKMPRFRKNKQEDTNATYYHESNHSPDFHNFINDTTNDLTFKDDPNESQIQLGDDDVISNEALYPAVCLTTSESESAEVEWKNRYCISTPNDFRSSYKIPKIDDPESKPKDEFKRESKFKPESEFKPETEAYVPRKRKHSGFDAECQAKIVQLVGRCNTESQDEDRMFLLSLLSDFKRVPIHKRLKVKSAFVTALADALDQVEDA